MRPVATLTRVTTPDLPEAAQPRARSRFIRYLPLWVSIIAVIVIATVTGILSVSIRELVQTRTMVDHTNMVLRTIDGMLIDIEDAESRQRGYVITGRASYLGLRALHVTVDSALASLAELVRDNPEQTRDIPQLASLVRRRLDRIDTTIALYNRSGFAAAAGVIREGTGSRLMDSVRAISETMKQRELALLSLRTDREKVILRRTTLVAALGVVLAASLFVVAVVLIRNTLKALAAGRRSASQAQALMQSTSDGIYGIDQDGCVSFVNRAMAETLGYAESQLIGRTAHALFHHTRADGSPCVIDECRMTRALVDGTGGRFEDEIIWRKDGTSIPVEYVISPMRGTRRGAVVSFRDITDRQRMDAALREGKLAAEAANRAKSDFLARMSHELRTPLNSVIGFANVLLRNKAENLRPQDLGYVERIQKNGINLLGLINDILDLSKIEAGRVEIDREPVDLQQLLLDIASQFETQVAAKDVRLVTRIPTEVAAIETDAGKLRQIVTNLVSNAIKFTDRGEVTIALDTNTAHVPIAISIRDSGIGIPASRTEAIFYPFEQAEKSTTRKYGGTGLGLPISRSLCELLGYDLRVASVEGKGSTFTIDLRPRHVESQDVMPAPETTQAADTGILRDKMVLIIDDDADARTLVSHQVASLGGRSAAAATGLDGLRLARTLKPDLITLDLLMPGMDGREIIEAFKADPEVSAIPIIIVSIVAREQGGGLFGAVSALSKPLDRTELTQALKHALGLGRVLVVDDDRDTQHLLSNYVYEAGAAEVRIASSSDAAVASLASFKPDLILLDLMMPDGDGDLVLEALARRADGTHPCSVIVVTSKELTGDESRHFELATLGVLRKGAELEGNLRKALNDFSRQRRLSPSRAIAQVELSPE